MPRPLVVKLYTNQQDSFYYHYSNFMCNFLLFGRHQLISSTTLQRWVRHLHREKEEGDAGHVRSIAGVVLHCTCLGNSNRPHEKKLKLFFHFELRSGALLKYVFATSHYTQKARRQVFAGEIFSFCGGGKATTHPEVWQPNSAFRSMFNLPGETREQMTTERESPFPSLPSFKRINNGLCRRLHGDITAA